MCDADRETVRQTSSELVPLLSSTGCSELDTLRQNIPVWHQFPAELLLWMDAGGTEGSCSHQALRKRERGREGERKKGE